MNILRKLLATSAAVVLAMTSGMLVAQADSPPTVYNTPGGQISGGRLWNTTCEKYSSNVVRCRANIWGTQVRYQGGRYVSTTGWTFNNLTYLPSPRASWVGNNLARNNENWNSGGRTWRTECDTATTGRGGCRSYVKTKQVAWEPGGYVLRTDWVFNNIVMFSSASTPAVTTVPRWIIDQSRLDATGLVPSPVQVDASLKDLERLGYYSLQSTDSAGEGIAWTPSPSLENRGVWTDVWMGREVTELTEIRVTEPYIRTVDGAHVGMTLGELKAIYGNRLRLETKHQIAVGPVYTAVVESATGEHELMFLSYGEYATINRPLVDSDVISSITAKRYALEIPYRP